MAKLTMLKPRLSQEAKSWDKAHGVPRRAGSWLQKQREQLFRAEPFCRECMAKGVRTLATIRDHIRPLGEGGTDDPGNIQPLCTPCSDAKTRQEGLRGRGLA
jgi:5-methylcytosine-specific restriction protein A